MTLWEFGCAVEGYRRAHSPDDERPPAMNEDRMRELGIEGL